MALRDNAIVAFAESKFVERATCDVWDYGAEMLETILSKTGLDKGDIDGLITGPSLTGAGDIFWPQVMADQLGLELNMCDGVALGGCSATAAVARTCALLDAGQCEAVLLLFADTPVAENNLAMRSMDREWVQPHGVVGPAWAFALLSSAYESRYGIDFTALGKLAVTQRNHGLLNPNALDRLRVPITVSDYINSPIIADPIRRLDCVMTCDGASALLMMSKRKARERGLDKTVVPIGYGERTNYRVASAQLDPTETGHVIAGERALAQAGVAREHLGSLHFYDDFLIAVPLQLENLGFCGRGQAMQFVNDTNLSYDGDLPLNTGGGQISAGQAACASVNLIEAVRQLLGEGGARQVKNTSSALVTGIGWINYIANWASSTALVLAPGD